MDIRQLTPRYFVAPQIDPADMALIKAQGITHILCNRPDAEVPPSHSAAAIEAAALAAGLSFENCPLTHQTMTMERIDENHQLGAARDGVTLAYCASGTRSCFAWALGQRGKMGADEIINAAQEAGYQMEQLRPALENPET
ncbi:MAG: TIGR01244 family sulfur transferase [Sulfitobacter sp.]